VRRMKRFRHAVIAVVAAYAVTYGLLVFIEYCFLAAHQQPEDHPRFPPEAAWVFPALHATMIFGVIAVIGFVVAVVSGRMKTPEEAPDKKPSMIIMFFIPAAL